jgi:hypothetical protein
MSCIPALFPTTRFECWCVFHNANPHVYRELERRVREAFKPGTKRMQARRFWEDMRADPTLQTTGSEFKCSDHALPYYVRLLMARNPELAGVFVVKDRKFDTTVEELVAAADRIDRERTRSEP